MTRFGPVSAVVPVYGGAATLRELHRRLNAVLSASCRDHEIVFVEDAGPDDAWRVIEALAREDGRVRGFRLARNAGQHNALLCGVRAAQFDLVVTLDDDLQHPPEEIPRLLEALSEHVDVVYGRPRALVHSPLRNAMSAAFKSISSRLLSAPRVADVSAFRAFRRELRAAFADYTGPPTSLDALLACATERFEAVSCEHVPRLHGRSGYDVSRLVRHAFVVWRGFASRSPRPGRGAARGKPAAPPLYAVVDRVGAREVTAAGAAARVVFRPIQPDDAERMFRWMQDPTVSRSIGLTREPSLEYTAQWIDEASAGHDRWARAIVADGTHVGNVVLDAMDSARERARFSIYLGEPDARGRGIGRAALARILEDGFRSLELRDIWLTVFAWNREAVGLYERAGFRPAVSATTGAADARPPDALLMSLSRERFMELQSSRHAESGA